MRRFFLVPALMISLLLSGCGGAAAAEQRIEKQRDSIAASALLRFTAAVAASLGDTVFQCTLDCAATADEVSITVVEPELIAGVKARIRDGETEVEYENVLLSVGAAGQEGLQPISAIPLLCGALKAGHVIRAWTEKADSGELIAADIFVDERYGLTVWFEKSNLTPVHAELNEDGAVIISCDISDFQIQ